jgi:hypothetical protein
MQSSQILVFSLHPIYAVNPIYLVTIQASGILLQLAKYPRRLAIFIKCAYVHPPLVAPTVVLPHAGPLQYGKVQFVNMLLQVPMHCVSDNPCGLTSVHTG